MADSGVIMRHNDVGEIIGLTIQHASSRKSL